MSEPNPLIDQYGSYQDQYTNKCTQWRSQPVENRKCRDHVCVGIFFLLFGAFIAIGIYYISQYNGLPFTQDTTDLYIEQYAGQVFGCISIAIVLSFLYIILVKIMPKAMVYFLLIFTLSLFLGFAILGFAYGSVEGGVAFLVVFLIYTAVLFCWRKKIDVGIVLIKVAANFLSQKWGVFLSPLIKIVLNIGLNVFWLYTISCIFAVAKDKSDNGQGTGAEGGFAFLWVLEWLFFTFLFYYMMVYTIAVACSFWYYKVEGKNFLFSAYKWIFTCNFGSIVFGSVLIALITLAKSVVDANKNQKNAAAAVCLCLLSICLSAVKNLVQILNHNAVIVMAVTGQSFIDAAKTTIGILSRYFPLMAVTDIISSLLIFWGVVITSGISGVISYFMLKDKMADDDGKLGLVILLVVMGSIMVSTLVLSVLIESISSVFIFYCFDMRFRELGYETHNMPNEIRQNLESYNSLSTDAK